MKAGMEWKWMKKELSLPFEAWSHTVVWLLKRNSWRGNSDFSELGSWKVRRSGKDCWIFVFWAPITSSPWRKECGEGLLWRSTWEKSPMAHNFITPIDCDKNIRDTWRKGLEKEYHSKLVTLLILWMSWDGGVPNFAFTVGYYTVTPNGRSESSTTLEWKKDGSDHNE